MERMTDPLSPERLPACGNRNDSMFPKIESKHAHKMRSMAQTCRLHARAEVPGKTKSERGHVVTPARPN